MDGTTPPKQDATGKSQVSGCLARLVWMAAGNLALLFLLLAIASRPAEQGFLSWMDAAYWAVVALLAGVRYVDITRLGGLTVNNDRATIRTWVRYAVLLAVLGSVLWAGVHLVSSLSLL